VHKQHLAFAGMPPKYIAETDVIRLALAMIFSWQSRAASRPCPAYSFIFEGGEAAASGSLL